MTLISIEKLDFKIFNIQFWLILRSIFYFCFVVCFLFVGFFFGSLFLFLFFFFAFVFLFLFCFYFVFVFVFFRKGISNFTFLCHDMIKGVFNQTLFVKELRVRCYVCVRGVYFFLTTCSRPAPSPLTPSLQFSRINPVVF